MGEKTCSVCKMDFKTLSLYRAHLETKRHSDRENAKTRMYICDCGKSYTQRQNMYRHRKACKKQASTVPVPDPCKVLNDRIQLLEMQIAELFLARKPHDVISQSEHGKKETPLIKKEGKKSIKL